MDLFTRLHLRSVLLSAALVAASISAPAPLHAQTRPATIPPPTDRESLQTLQSQQLTDGQQARAGQQLTEGQQLTAGQQQPPAQQGQTAPPAAPRQTPYPSIPAPTPPAQNPSPWPSMQSATSPRARKVQRAHASEVKNGTLTTHDGMRLRLDTEIGNVRIFTDAVNELRYVVRIESDEIGPRAEQYLHEFQFRAQEIPMGVSISGQVPRKDLRDRLWVTYELHVPRRYNLDVNTQAGNIQVDDVDGRISLVTNGGNITAGRVTGGTRVPGTPAARLESLGGGHISVLDVTGDLRATTAGGHITAGNVQGDATLTTGGGHIHAGIIKGVAQLQTGGGNISVERAGGRVTASSGGGQISFGEAAGAIQARTSGGGIRVLRVAGPMQLDSNGGSIFLTKVENSVRASTGTGSITAWLSPSLKVTTGSQLESGQGDIIVYVPRQLQVTIEATIDTSLGHRIIADPALAMKTISSKGDSGKQVRSVCAINGGGEVLRLHALEGNIQLRFMDEAFLRQQSLIQAQIRQEIETSQVFFQTLVQQSVNQSVEEIKKQTAELERLSAMQAATAQKGRTVRVTPAGGTPRPDSVPEPPDPPTTEILWMKLDELWWGGVRVDPEEQEKRLIHQVRPEYPDVARQAGIDGTVSMRVLINKDGRVEKIDVLSGEQTLEDAAVAAVRQWQYRPFLLEKKPVPVVTVVNLEFKLQ